MKHRLNEKEIIVTKLTLHACMDEERKKHCSIYLVWVKVSGVENRSCFMT